MTEKEKRDNQELYNPNYDKELIKEMEKVKDLCFEYNNINPSAREKRKALIKKNIRKNGRKYFNRI